MIEMDDFTSNSKFDNKIFWEKRYNENMDLGSGIGSRVVFGSKKKEIVEKILKK